VFLPNLQVNVNQIRCFTRNYRGQVRVRAESMFRNEFSTNCAWPAACRYRPNMASDVSVLSPLPRKRLRILFMRHFELSTISYFINALYSLEISSLSLLFYYIFYIKSKMRQKNANNLKLIIIIMLNNRISRSK